MRRLLCLFALAPLAATPTFAPAAALPADAPACTASTATGGDIRVLTCALTAGRPYRLTANFSGGHDDTSASLAATLDGQPVDCEADSKTRLFGEDGDVSLHCRIRAGGDPAPAHVLVVTVLWSHAQFRDFTYGAD